MNNAPDGVFVGLDQASDDRHAVAAAEANTTIARRSRTVEPVQRVRDAAASGRLGHLTGALEGVLPPRQPRPTTVDGCAGAPERRRVRAVQVWVTDALGRMRLLAGAHLEVGVCGRTARHPVPRLVGDDLATAAWLVWSRRLGRPPSRYRSSRSTCGSYAPRPATRRAGRRPGPSGKAPPPFPRRRERYADRHSTWCSGTSVRAGATSRTGGVGGPSWTPRQAARRRPRRQQAPGSARPTAYAPSVASTTPCRRSTYMRGIFAGRDWAAPLVWATPMSTASRRPAFGCVLPVTIIIVLPAAVFWVWASTCDCSRLCAAARSSTGSPSASRSHGRVDAAVLRRQRPAADLPV